MARPTPSSPACVETRGAAREIEGTVGGNWREMSRGGGTRCQAVQGERTKGLKRTRHLISHFCVTSEEPGGGRGTWPH